MQHYILDLCGVNSSCVSSTHHILTPSMTITHSKFVFYHRHTVILYCQGKAIPLQAWTGPEDSRSLRLPDFKTFGT